MGELLPSNDSQMCLIASGELSRASASCWGQLSQHRDTFWSVFTVFLPVGRGRDHGKHSFRRWNGLEHGWVVLPSSLHQDRPGLRKKIKLKIFQLRTPDPWVCKRVVEAELVLRLGLRTLNRAYK